MPLKSHGWTVMMHPLLIGQVLKLIAASQKAFAKDPAAGAIDPNTKLLSALSRLMFDHIPADPAHEKYRQGDTLGKDRKHWFRAKFGNGRFRLFFRFSSAHRIIVFAWVNDAASLRTFGSKTDAYRVFKAMLDDGNPPEDWQSLMKACAEPDGATAVKTSIEALYLSSFPRPEDGSGQP
jgi:toxin YhaV